MCSFFVRLHRGRHALLHVPGKYCDAITKLLTRGGYLNWSEAYMVAQLPGARWSK